MVVADGDGNGGGGGKRLKYGSMAYIANWGCDAKTTTLHTHSGARTQKSAYKNTLKSTQKHTKRIILTQNLQFNVFFIFFYAYSFVEVKNLTQVKFWLGENIIISTIFCNFKKIWKLEKCDHCLWYECDLGFSEWQVANNKPHDSW